MKILLLLTLTGAALLSLTAGAAQTRAIDLGSTTTWNLPESTATFDPNLELVHVPSTVGGDPAKALDFGDGRDGAFSDGPAQTGITVAGPVITVDTDAKAVFQFTNFLLNAGMTLVAKGSRPLVIRSLGDVTIAGTVSVDGDPGVNGTAGGAPAPRGGAGAAGAGGAGAAANGTPAAFAGSPSPAGGGASSGTAGGGGGCLGTNGGGDAANDAFAGTNAAPADAANAGTCAGTRASVATAFESAFTGGAGGGGGGSATTAAGGSGGGGGGAIHIVAFGDINLSGGTLRARGGAGGGYDAGSAPNSCGGGGGGGAGGAVWLQNLGSLFGGTVDVSFGLGGTSTICGNTHNGGHGSRGVLRCDNPAGSCAGIAGGGGSVTPATVAGADPAATVATATGQDYVMLSKAVAFNDGYYAFSAPVESFETDGVNGCGTDGQGTVEYEGSDDGIRFGAPVPRARISELDGSAYLRFRVRLRATGANPPCFKGLTFGYDTKDVSSFVLHGGGLACGTLLTRDGGRGGHGGGGRNGGAPLRDAAGDLALLTFAFGIAFGIAFGLRHRLERHAS